jgi:acyl-CoA reductase-like NAD-dependent aldehyde dehydrogenase
VRAAANEHLTPVTLELGGKRWLRICHWIGAWMWKRFALMRQVQKFPCHLTVLMSSFSPVYIDNTVDLNIAVKRILWGKCINAGQTCVSPDYILCSEAVQSGFVAEAKEVLREWYGSDVQSSPDFSRIISDKHYK